MIVGKLGYRLWSWPSKVSSFLPTVFRRRLLSTISLMIEQGRLREINAFGSEVHHSDFEAVMEAYSNSSFVHIPVNRLPLGGLNIIEIDVLEKMLASSLLCNHRGTSTSIAREICSRYLSSTDMHSYGQCMLAFHADEQHADLSQLATAQGLSSYLMVAQRDIPGGLMHSLFHVQVTAAALQNWIHTANITETVEFLDNLLTAEGVHTGMESILIGSPSVLQNTLQLLRHHGYHALSHRLLSLLQHNLQRQVFPRSRVQRQDHCQSHISRGVNDLVTFLGCLHAKEDMVYMSGVHSFYLKSILPLRVSHASRLIDVENILNAILTSPCDPEPRSGTLFLANSVESRERFQMGYYFYCRLQRQRKGRGLHSPKIYSQLAHIIGRLSPEDLTHERAHKRSIKVKKTRKVGEDKRLAVLQRLQKDFTRKFSYPQSKSSFKSHLFFYSSCMSSLNHVFESWRSDVSDVSRERRKCLSAILHHMRAAGLPIGFSAMMSKSLVELFIFPHACELEQTLDANICELLSFVKENSECFHEDTVLKNIIIFLGNKSRYRHGDMEHTGDISSAEQESGECLRASQSICRFLRRLSDDGSIDTFHGNSHRNEEEFPVQHFKSFKECSRLEWRTIVLLQKSCEKILSLSDPAVIPDLMTVLSALSTHQLVPYSFWSQAIELCDKGKKWEEMKVLLQILLYQGKMIQFANAHSVLAAYTSTHSPHVGYRLVQAMRRETGAGTAISAEAYRALCVALGRLSGREEDGAEHAVMAEKTFGYLFESYGPIAFTGNFDTSRGADLVKHRTAWAINSRDESMIKKHIRECERHMSSPSELQRVYENMLTQLPSQCYEAGIFAITTMLSNELCLPSDGDIDRFIDAAIADDRLTLAASMLRTIKQLKEKYLIVHPEGESDDSDVDDDIDINDDVNIC